MAQNKPVLTAAQEKEIVQAYEDKTSTAKELAEMFSIHEVTVYALLKKHDVTPHLKRNPKPRGSNRNGPVVIRKIDPETVALPPEEIEVPVMHKAPVAVQVDKNQNVQAIRYRQPLERFEVRYTGTMIIEADSLEEALAEARKVPAVKKIIYVGVKNA
jgi:hypothetical protein